MSAQVKVRCPAFKEGQEVEFQEFAARTRSYNSCYDLLSYEARRGYALATSDFFYYCSGMKHWKVARIHSNFTYDIINTVEDRVDKQVPEEDLRAPEGAISYADLVALVKVRIIVFYSSSSIIFLNVFWGYRNYEARCNMAISTNRQITENFQVGICAADSIFTTSFVSSFFIF